MPAIYCLINKITWKGYIGIVKDGDVDRRFQEHVLSTKYQDTILYRSLRKHGKENFSLYKIMDVEDWEECCRLEIVLIKEYTLVPLGYNTSTVQFPLPPSYSHPKEVRERIGKAQKAWYARLSEEEKLARAENQRKRMIKYYSVNREKKLEQMKERTSKAFREMTPDKRKQHSLNCSKGLHRYWLTDREKKSKLLGEKTRKGLLSRPYSVQREHAEKNSAANLERNPNIDRRLVLKGDLSRSIKDGPSEKIALVIGESHLSCRELEEILFKNYTNVPESVHVGGEKQYWRSCIFGMVRSGKLVYEDGNPHIPAR